MRCSNPTKNEQNLQFSDVCILVQGTTNESETNKINISCSSQVIVFIALLDSTALLDKPQYLAVRWKCRVLLHQLFLISK